MALFSAATIDISMSDVFLTDELSKNATSQRVHMLLAEYAKKQYALVVCELVDGVNVCADPPKVIYSIGFPSDQLSFTFVQESMSVVVSAQRTSSFTLTFVKGADFWGVARIIVDAQAVEEDRKGDVKALLKDAVTTIPTVSLLPSGLVEDA